MSRPIVLTWPTRDFQYICAGQTANLNDPSLTITTNGTAFASSGSAQNSFDNNIQTACTQTAPDGNIGYNFGGKHIIHQVGIISNTNQNYTLVFEHSNDGTTWNPSLTTGSTDYNQGAVVWLTMSFPDNGVYFRIREDGGATLDIQQLYFNEKAPFKFNGTFYQQEKNKGLSITSVPFIDVARSVTVSSDNDQTGINFIINGVLNGVAVSETVLGPNATSAETQTIFDAITSIYVTGNVTNPVNIGMGSVGRTKYFLYNRQCTFPMLSIQVTKQILGEGEDVNYSFGFTLDEVNNNLYPNHIFPTGVLQQQSDSAFDYVEFTMCYAFIQVNQIDDDITLTTTFLQQGIK